MVFNRHVLLLDKDRKAIIKVKHGLLANLGSFILILAIILLLIISLRIEFRDILSYNVSISTLVSDLGISFVRVTLAALLAWITAIVAGALLNNHHHLRTLCSPLINLIRHISPFAWFPFAIIWFGLGERPIAFVLIITLFFPALVAAREIFADIPREYLDEAKVCGANMLQLFMHIEIRLTVVPLINLLRILWGLGWTAVIAVEMLGTAKGLGYRLLDFRYLLYYEEMILYIVVMGAIGVLVDKFLAMITTLLRK